jgi:hypothetical protein
MTNETKFAHAVSRTFSKRDEDDIIGSAAWRILPDASMEFAIDDGDFKPLPVASIQHLMFFALQTLQDAYAGKSGEDAIAAWKIKAAKIVDGTIGTRGQSSGVSLWQSIARSLVRDVVKASKPAEYKAADADERNAMLDEVIAKNRDKLDPAIQKEIARRNAASADAASLSITL